MCTALGYVVSRFLDGGQRPITSDKYLAPPANLTDSRSTPYIASMPPRVSRADVTRT